MEWLKQVHHGAEGTRVPEFRSGDEVRVWYRIQERGRTRVTPFEGTVIRVRGAGPSKTMTVRRVTFGEGVERVFQLNGPTIDRMEVVRRGKVRRSRLYFLRTVVGKTRIELAQPRSLDTGSASRPASETPADATATPAQPSGREPQAS